MIRPPSTLPTARVRSSEALSSSLRRLKHDALLAAGRCRIRICPYPASATFLPGRLQHALSVKLPPAVKVDLCPSSLLEPPHPETSVRFGRGVPAQLRRDSHLPNLTCSTAEVFLNSSGLPPKITGSRADRRVGGGRSFLQEDCFRDCFLLAVLLPPSPFCVGLLRILQLSEQSARKGHGQVGRDKE